MWEIKNISKNFGGVNALSDFSVSMEEGKIYGLVGANGAGKSTLVKCLTGTVAPDKGGIYKDGEKLVIESPRDAYSYDIYASYQEGSLAPHLTVLENMLLGVEPKKQGVFLNHDEMITRAKNLLDLVEEEIPLDEEVKNLSEAKKQIVEVLKVLPRGPELALFDEPTSFLSEDQIESLFKIIRDFAEDITVVFVSHRLDEIFEICDEVIVARNGNMIGKFDTEEIDEDSLSVKMAGSEELARSSIGQLTTGKEKSPEETGGGAPLLSVSNLTVENRLKDLTFNVGKGEILGIAGLRGHGQSALLECLYGLIPYEGSTKLEDQNLSIDNPKKAIENGLIYVSGDRDEEGILHSRSVKENIALIKNGANWLISPVDEDMERDVSNQMVDELDIECENLEAPASSLSGGNQQKLFLARGLAEEPEVLLLNDPFRGVDVMTRRNVLEKLCKIAKDRAIIFYSSNVEEVASIASRVLVMYEGKVIAEFKGEEINPDEIEEVSIRGERVNNG